MWIKLLGRHIYTDDFNLRMAAVEYKCYCYFEIVQFCIVLYFGTYGVNM